MLIKLKDICSLKLKLNDINLKGYNYFNYLEE